MTLTKQEIEKKHHNINFLCDEYYFYTKFKG